MPDLTVYSSTDDGHLQCYDATYSNARTGSGTKSADTTATTVNVGQQYFSGTMYYCWEAFLDFDTSSIPDTATVGTVTLSLWASSITDDDTGFDVRAYEYDWDTSLTTADWFYTSTGKTLAASAASSTWSSTSAYFDLTSQSGFPGVVSLTGETRLGVVSSRHIGGSTPTGDEFMIFFSANYTGTTRDPKLVVSYMTVHEASAALGLTFETTGSASRIAVADAQLGLTLSATASAVRTMMAAAALSLGVGVVGGGVRDLESGAALQFGLGVSGSGVRKGVSRAALTFGLALAGRGLRVRPYMSARQMACPRCGLVQVDELVTRCSRCGHGLAGAGKSRFRV